MAWDPLPEDRAAARSVRDSLETLQRRLGLARPDTVRQLESAWSELVGARLAERCRPGGMRDGRLSVVTEDPVVAEALRWQAADLCAAANDLIGGEVVTEVVVRVQRPGTDWAGSG
jgi:predicted nucleic acid-binding Zn ribbon protein